MCRVVFIRVMLVPGYLPELSREEITQLRHGLTWKMQQSDLIPGQQQLFNSDPTTGYGKKVRSCIEKFWQEMIDNGKIDAARDSYVSYRLAPSINFQ